MTSVSQMVNFPLDKIAKSLVEEETTGIKEHSIVRAIAALGASLGISTVVEGVTTPERLSRIQMDGCSSIQGGLFSDAVSTDMLITEVGQLTMPKQTTTTVETHK